MIVASTDLHALGGYYSRWPLLHIMLYFEEATIQRGLLNKGVSISRKLGMQSIVRMVLDV